MSNSLWFTNSVDICYSGLNAGRPVSQLIDFTVHTNFNVSDGAIAALRVKPWVELVRRRRGRRSLQLIVRCGELPQELRGANSREAFRAHLEKLLYDR